ncbi:MAG: calcineurin-like phosphoesterase C-terminal domain-containing protein [Bacteroidales bacterium]|nr:calcineurin-like phosphoesterase C-terminal domain-containing protein [Bacteroidales bacterium]
MPKADSGKLAANLIIPKSFEAVSGGTVSIPTLGDTRLDVGDDVYLVAVDGSIYASVLSSVSPSEVAFPLPDGVISAYYSLLIRCSGNLTNLGYVYVSILSGSGTPVSVEPEAGSTVYGIVECEGRGLPGVVVSDGYEVVKTDWRGVYQMSSGKMWKYVFISLPSGYEAPLQGVLPGFFADLTQDASRPERHDFQLRRVANDNFTLFLLGDMHLAGRADDIPQFRRDMRYLNNSISKAKGRCYVLTLGDMTWDAYWYSKNYYFPQYLSEVNRWFTDVPFFHTMGNHDNDMNEVGDIEKTRAFNRNLGPSYYSFNLGKVHFIVTDNIDYNNVEAGTDHRGEYVHDFTADQMEWLAKDLANVSPATPVVIASHSPLFKPEGATTWTNKLDGADAPGEANTEDFINAVKGYNVRFVSGHTHRIAIYDALESQGFIEYNLGSVCGCWWNCCYAEPDIHLCPDGSPCGYGVWEFTGAQLKHRYQAFGMPENYVFRAYSMGEVKNTLTMEAVDNEAKFQKYYDEMQRFDDNDLLLNVWYYHSAWQIEVLADGTPLSMTRDYSYDPLLTWAMTANYYGRHETSNSLVAPSRWTHYFRYRVPEGSSHVDVRVTDNNGVVHTESFSWPKPFSMDEYRIVN